MFFQNVRKGRQEWYLYLMTILLVVLGYIMGQFPMTAALFYQMDRVPEIGMDEFERFQENPDFSLFQIPANLGFILILFIFVFAITGLYVGIRFLHKRSFVSLIRWAGHIDWRRIAWGFLFWLGLSLAFEAASYFLDPGNYRFETPGLSFIWLLLLSFLLLPVQTSFEELFFRGYIMQGIGYALRNKWLAWLISSLVFMSVHLMNPEISEYGLLNMIPYYLVAGLFLGYITIMDDRLELALGVHAATNFFGAVFVSYEGAALQTDALFTVTEVNALYLGFIFLVFSLVFIFFAHKTFGWKSPLTVFRHWEEN